VDDIYLPAIGSCLYIREEISPSIRLYQRVHHIINALSVDGLSNSTEHRHSTYILRPNEWYIIENIIYPSRTYSLVEQPGPYVSLSLLRSKTGREWVRDRLKEISDDMVTETQSNININSDEHFTITTKCNIRPKSNRFGC